MFASKLVPPLMAVAALLLVISGALAAVVLSDGDSGDTSPLTLSNSSPTPEPRVAPASTGTAILSLVPPELRGRFEALPEKLREQARAQLESGQLKPDQLVQLIESYENRNSGVRVGTVLDATEASLRIEVYATGERVQVLVDSKTVVRRAVKDFDADDLQHDELVMVLSMDGGTTAFAIQAFGLGAP
jgi:hypothetical protein